MIVVGGVCFIAGALAKHPWLFLIADDIWRNAPVLSHEVRLKLSPLALKTN